MTDIKWGIAVVGTLINDYGLCDQAIDIANLDEIMAYFFIKFEDRI